MSKMIAMRLFRTILLFISIVSIDVHGQWMPCPGLEGADISQILVYDSIMLISGTGNGVFRKHLNEQEWYLEHYNGYYRRLRANDTCIFAANDSWYTNFARSFDSGETWEELDDVYSLEIIGEKVFIIASPGMGTHIFRSDDNGDTWVLIKEDANIYFWHLFANDSTLFCTNEVNDSAIISQDMGATWETISMEYDYGNIWAEAIYNYNGIYIAGTYMGNGIYYYDTSLDHWFSFNNNTEYVYPKCFIEINDTLYCCAYSGFYKFIQQDSTWENQTVSLGNIEVNSAFQLGERIYLATSHGPYYRDDGMEWMQEIKGLYQLNVQQIIPANDTIYALSDDRLYFALNAEIGFDTLETDWITPPKNIITTDTIWYAGSDSGFMKSDNSGYSWSYFNDGFEFNPSSYQVAVTNEYCFASNGGLYRAHKDTMYFRRVPNWIGNTSARYLASIDEVIFASISNEGVFRSGDFGNTFQHITESSSFDDEIHVIDGKVYIYGYTEVYRSSDFGLSWELYQDSIYKGWHAPLDVLDETMVIASSFAPMNDVWINIYSPMYPDGLMINDNIEYSYWPWSYDVFVRNHDILVSLSNNSIWYRNDLSVRIPDEEESLKEERRIKIYPNPAIEYINIECEWEISVFQLYDIWGRKYIERNINREKCLIDLNGLESGVYFIRIKSGDKWTSEKIILY